MSASSSSTSTVTIRNLSFCYASSPVQLISNLSIAFPEGFTGIVGANGAGKTTLLQLVAGVLTPDEGSIEGVDHAVYCEQRTDHPPESLQQFLDDWSAEAFELRGRLNIDDDFTERWSSLSHGERKRAQIGHAIWQAPSLLAIDEPTNHIDASARNILIQALKRFRGIGLIVSHDRTLLDALCTQCVWLEGTGASVYKGGFTACREQREAERSSAIAERQKASRENRKLQRELISRREHAEREHRDRSKKGLSAKDSDAREKIDRARVTDSGAGSRLRQLDGRIRRARTRLDQAQVEKAYETGIWLPGSRSPRDTIFTVEEEALPLGDGRTLAIPRLRMRSADRIAVTGPNGSGKSTLLRHLLKSLNTPEDRIVYMPQELSAVESSRILEDVRSLQSSQLGHIMNIVSRLGSRPDRLLDSQQPSPGEVRKLLLALGMSRAPHIIILDEPTNHLDLPSIEAVESALADCPCALLLVSHDMPFLDRIGTTIWRIETDQQHNSQLIPD